MNADDPVIAELLARCERDHHAWINGDGSAYELPDEGSILGAVGGCSLGGPDTLQRQQDLRATEIFRLVDGTWQRVHRHADPLVDRRDLADIVHLCT